MDYVASIGGVPQLVMRDVSRKAAILHSLMRLRPASGEYIQLIPGPRWPDDSFFRCRVALLECVARFRCGVCGNEYEAQFQDCRDLKCKGCRNEGN